MRDVSCVQSCGRQLCLGCRSVFRIRVLLLLLLLLLLRSVALLRRWCPAGVPFIVLHFLCVFPPVLLFTKNCFYIFFVMIFISSAAMRFRVAVSASGLSLPTHFSAIWLVSSVEMLMCAAHHYLLEVQMCLFYSWERACTRAVHRDDFVTHGDDRSLDVLDKSVD